MAGRKDAQDHGVTLPELLLAIGIGAALLTLAAPTLGDLMQRQRVRLTAQDLLHTLLYARNHAVHGARRVVLCPSADGENCLRRPEWHRGWILFEDDDGDREHRRPERVLRVAAAAPDTIRILAPVSRRRIRYLPDGSSPGSNLTMTVCDTTGVAPPHAVIVSNTGRPRQAARGPRARRLNCR